MAGRKLGSGWDGESPGGVVEPDGWTTGTPTKVWGCEGAGGVRHRVVGVREGGRYYSFISVYYHGMINGREMSFVWV